MEAFLRTSLGFDQEMVDVFWRTVYCLAVAAGLVVMLFSLLIVLDKSSSRFHNAIVKDNELRKEEARKREEREKNERKRKMREMAEAMEELREERALESLEEGEEKEEEMGKKDK
jgi:hypothetical protein